jgi:predicted PurR-regulated permease PerM
MSSTAGQASRMLTGLLAAAGIVIVVAGLRYAAPILAPVLFAITLAILFTPLLRRLEHRGLPTALALVVMLVGMVLFFGAVLLVVYLSLLKLQERMPTYEALLAQRLAPLNDALNARGIPSGGLPPGWSDGSSLINAALAAITALLSSAVGVIFFLFTLCLLLIESSSLGRKFRAGLQPESPFLQRMQGYTREIQRQYRIQCFSNFLSAVVLTVEFLAFRIDFALLWGFLAFILGFIPNVGLIIACLPAIVLALILHGPGTAAVVLILGIILNAAMDNAVTPRFMSSGLQLPVLVSFLSFLFWTWVFGFLGALLAIPATLFLRALLSGNHETRLAADLLSGAAPGAGEVAAGNAEEAEREDAGRIADAGGADAPPSRPPEG